MSAGYRGRRSGGETSRELNGVSKRGCCFLNGEIADLRRFRGEQHLCCLMQGISANDVCITYPLELY
jgi:hypothetical protein